MRQDVLELVKQLSISDTKTLSQKSNKLFEEGGELAKHILPYESAAGTLHRVVNKAKLLEEVADVMLVALSIAYELDFDDDAITSEMQRKAMYWASIQHNESNINTDKIPHEIHVTVESAVSVESFRLACKAIGVKPVVLALHTTAPEAIRDVMTSQVVIGTTRQAFEAMDATKAGLVGQGYKVVRSKIEAAPWHPAAPTAFNRLKHTDDNYFESHIEVFVSNAGDTDQTMEKLKECIGYTDAHLSNNFFKENDTSKTVMVTFRRYIGTFEQFKSELDELKSHIKQWGFEYNRKDIVEYSIYDSKVDHDAEWMNG